MYLFRKSLSYLCTHIFHTEYDAKQVSLIHHHMFCFILFHQVPCLKKKHHSIKNRQVLNCVCRYRANPLPDLNCPSPSNSPPANVSECHNLSGTPNNTVIHELLCHCVRELSVAKVRKVGFFIFQHLYYIYTQTCW